MSVNFSQGTSFVGYVSLTNGAPAANIPVKIWARDSATPDTLDARDVLVVTSIACSSNDTANPLLTITDNSPANPTTLYSAYVGPTQIAPVISPGVGVLKGYAGKNLRASAAAVTAAKTIEVVVAGVIVRIS